MGRRRAPARAAGDDGAAEALGERANFGEVDIDRHPELAKSARLMNVPAVAYYHNGQPVAVLIGADRNVAARVERVLRGEPIGYNDGTSAGATKSRRQSSPGRPARATSSLCSPARWCPAWDDNGPTFSERGGARWRFGR